MSQVFLVSAVQAEGLMPAKSQQGSLGKYQQFHGNKTFKIKLFRAWLREDLEGVVDSCMSTEKLI